MSVRYWQHQLRGPMGTVTIAPHVRATRDTEFLALMQFVRRRLGNSAQALENLFRDAAS